MVKQLKNALKNLEKNYEFTIIFFSFLVLTITLILIKDILYQSLSLVLFFSIILTIFLRDKIVRWDKEFLENYKHFFKEYREFFVYFGLLILIMQVLIFLSYFFSFVREFLLLIFFIILGIFLIKISSKVRDFLPSKILFFIFYVISPNVLRDKEKFEKLLGIISLSIFLLGITIIILSPLMIMGMKKIYITVISIMIAFSIISPIIYSLILEKNLFP